MAFNGKYTSVERIIENLKREEGYDSEISFQDVVEWVGDAMDLIGARIPMVTVVTEEAIEVTDYRGEMPTGWLQIVAVRDFNTKEVYTPKTGSFFPPKSSEVVCSSKNYHAQDCYIFTSEQTAKLEIEYTMFPLDCRGYPKIPEDTRYIKAVQAYIRLKIDHLLWRQGKTSSDVYLEAKEDWRFMVNSARNKMNMPTPEEMVSMRSLMTSLVPRINEHSTSFKNLGKLQRLFPDARSN